MKAKLFRCLILAVILSVNRGDRTNKEVNYIKPNVDDGKVVVDIKDGIKTQYLKQNVDIGAYDFGYEISPSGPFHHENRGPDGVTYGCYGYINAFGLLMETSYVADGRGYRVVKPYKPVKVYPESKNGKDHDHKSGPRKTHGEGVLVDWQNFPKGCLRTPGTPGRPGTPGSPGPADTPAIPGSQEGPVGPGSPGRPQGSNTSGNYYQKTPGKPGSPGSPASPGIAGTPGGYFPGQPASASQALHLPPEKPQISLSHLHYAAEGIAMQMTHPALLNRAAARKYEDLPVPCEKILSTYIWIDGSGLTTRAKDRTLDFVPKEPKDMPVWYFDGSCTNQASGENSDTFLFPQKLYHDPFRRGSHVIVLSDTYKSNYAPTETNFRKSCLEVCDKSELEEPWFGFQQDVMLMTGDNRPLGWPAGGYPAPPGPYYCGVGANKVIARDLMEAFYRCCLFAGVNIFGINPGETPAQWSFQLGPSPGIGVADDLWLSRYLLERLSEEYGVMVSYEPQPAPHWPGCGLFTYFSTRDMRDSGGILVIEKAIDQLSRRHAEHMAVYDLNSGLDNEKRLRGNSKTTCYKDFTAGVANRICSIRIPRQVSEDKQGYFEDRRPASNADPYRIIETMIRTCIFNE